MKANELFKALGNMPGICSITLNFDDGSEIDSEDSATEDKGELTDALGKKEMRGKEVGKSKMPMEMDDAAD